MRISDWSSDVCSSDLQSGMTMRSLLLRRLARCLDDRGKIERAVAGGGEGFVEVARLGADRRVGIDARRRLDREAQILEHQRGREAARIIVIRRAFGADAGRSEERRVGKRVSVSVDLGGRRIIKKKKNQ